MANGTHTYVPAGMAGLRALHENGRLSVSEVEVLTADASDEEQTYAALAEADEISVERVVIEVEGDGVIEFGIDDVVAIYVELAWYGVQELGALVA